MPTFLQKSEVNGSRIKPRRYDDLGSKNRWKFRWIIADHDQFGFDASGLGSNLLGAPDQPVVVERSSNRAN